MILTSPKVTNWPIRLLDNVSDVHTLQHFNTSAQVEITQSSIEMKTTYFFFIMILHVCFSQLPKRFDCNFIYLVGNLGVSFLDCPSPFQNGSWKIFNTHRPKTTKQNSYWKETKKYASIQFLVCFSSWLGFLFMSSLKCLSVLFFVLCKPCTCLEYFCLPLAKECNPREQCHSD